MPQRPGVLRQSVPHEEVPRNQQRLCSASPVQGRVVDMRGCVLFTLGGPGSSSMGVDNLVHKVFSDLEPAWAKLKSAPLSTALAFLSASTCRAPSLRECKQQDESFERPATEPFEQVRIGRRGYEAHVCTGDGEIASAHFSAKRVHASAIFRISVRKYAHRNMPP